MKTYHILETPKLYAIFWTEAISDLGVLSNNALDSPDTTIKIIIEDSTGTVVQALDDMAEDSTGKFSYIGYTIANGAATGIWHYNVVGTDTDGVSIGKGSFEVLEEVA